MSRSRPFAAAAIAVSALGLPLRAGSARPQRIVSLIPSVTEMLFTMGAGSRVVGVGSSIDIRRVLSRPKWAA